MRVTGLIWLIWLLSSLGSFLVLEGIALWNRWPNDTLTAVSTRDVPWYVGLAALVGAFFAALIHWGRSYRDHDGKMR
jgi:hypothetical protein